jgi:hypothetical protein
MKHRRKIIGAGAFNFTNSDAALAESDFENVENVGSIEMDKNPLSAGGFAIKRSSK